MAESRTGGWQRFADLLAPHGYAHVSATPTAPGKNGVLVIARTPFHVLPAPHGPMFEQRWQRLVLEEYGLTMLACHVPPKISVGVDAKRAFWQTLLTTPREPSETRRSSSATSTPVLRIATSTARRCTAPTSSSSSRRSDGSTPGGVFTARQRRSGRGSTR